jgi:hypothetical protein
MVHVSDHVTPSRNTEGGAADETGQRFEKEVPGSLEHRTKPPLIEALGTRCQTSLVPGAIHIDAEWPTDALAELACGKSSDQNRAAFASHALTALKAALLSPPH